MKPFLPLLLALMTTTALAGPTKITVHGGDSDQANAIVTFDAPKEWKGDYSLSNETTKMSCLLQVDAWGKAAMIVPKIGAGETITFNAGIAPKNPPPAGLLPRRDGNVLHFVHLDGAKTTPIFDYQMVAGEVPQGVPAIFKHGAHLHPVYSPSGRIVTGNHPADHPWHRGIWMAWTHTEFEGHEPDFWNQGKGEGKNKDAEKLLAEVRFENLEREWSGYVQAGFISKHRFIDHNSGVAKDVLNETWEVTAYAVRGDKPMYIVDFVSTQTCAGQSPVKLPKYHYGGLGVRGNQLWNPVDKVTMLTSNGDDRAKGDSTKAKWVQMGGDVDGQATGMAILIHPDNFRFPQPLRLNPKNPQLCIAPSQGGDWSIEPGKPYVSKYRFVISDGAADAAAIEAAWQGYAKPLKVTWE